MKKYVIALISLLVVSQSAFAAGSNTIRLSGTVPDRGYRIQNSTTQGVVLVTTESSSLKVYSAHSTAGQWKQLEARQTLASSSLIRVEAP